MNNHNTPMADGGMSSICLDSAPLRLLHQPLSPIDTLLPLDPWDRSMPLIGEGQGQGQELLTGPTASVTRHDRH